MNKIYLIIFTVLFSAHALADVQPADFRQKASDKVWEEKIKPGVFKEQEIIEGAAQDVLELKAPFRAEDAAIVPISVHARFPQTEERYIEKIHIYIDKNPLPLVGIFEFGPASGQADLAMRVRVDDFTYVRAIATMNNGELYMSKTFVRATGACSAPPPKSIKDSIANLGQMKMKTIGDLEAAKPNLVQLKILHPNITGLQPLRIGSRVMPPPHFVKDLDVDFNGQNVLKASLTFSISMDPALRFFFVPNEAGVITVKGSDTKKNEFSHTHEIAL
ncbi:MAG: quinoprotein dehydrogenase-associated SoxYZ-like carrier [Thiotrichales bacterium]|nr:quinoprotein dehydrogenase-associated SoxYZ-like carrier [Thiotrichales bacterium]